MLFSDPHALVAKQNGHPFDWNTGEEQFDCERVTESVGVSVLYICQLEQFA